MNINLENRWELNSFTQIKIFQGKCLENRVWSTKESQHLGAERRKRKPQDILRITSLKIGNNPGKSGAVEENIGRRYF